jgi:hypothetical protein
MDVSAMNPAYISAFAALAGSAIGALASFATTWLTQHVQERAARLVQEKSRRERVYGEFINEASRLLADALTHHLEDPSKMVALYAIMGKLRLFAPTNVVARAEEVMGQIVEIYDLPNADFRNPSERPAQHRVDILRTFGETCRDDLHRCGRRGRAAHQESAYGTKRTSGNLRSTTASKDKAQTKHFYEYTA